MSARSFFLPHSPECVEKQSEKLCNGAGSSLLVLAPPKKGASMEGNIYSSRQARLSIMVVTTVTALAACLVALLWWQAVPAHSATKVPTGFTDSLVAKVNNPTSMAIAPDGASS
jgi:hypothetical protein